VLYVLLAFCPSLILFCLGMLRIEFGAVVMDLWFKC